MSLDTGKTYQIIMAENQRHFKVTTVGRKRIPISEVVKPVEKTVKKTKKSTAK